MSKRVVRIIQCLCPKRHCIVAIAYESATGEADPERMSTFRKSLKALLDLGGIDPWCGICRSRTWSYEDERTTFKSLEQAAPALLAVQEAQRITAQHLKAETN